MTASKKITHKDIARECNVSRVTVTRVLNNTEGSWVSDEMRRHILNTAKRLNYKGKSTYQSFIGMVLPVAHAEMSLRLLNGVVLAAEKLNYGVSVVTTSHDPHHEMEMMQSLISRGMEGLIISPAVRRCSDATKKMYGYDEFSLPIVAVDICCDYFNTAKVIFDYRKVTADLTGMLLDAGHQRIGFLHYFRNWFHPGCEMRYEGYLDALKARGMEPDPELLQYPEERNPEIVSLEVRRLIKAGATAIITQNDITAIKVINELQELGLKVPQDIRVTGFDNISAGKVHHPSITTVEAPWERMGETASDLLMKMINGGQRCTDKVILAPEIVSRES